MILALHSTENTSWATSTTLDTYTVQPFRAEGEFNVPLGTLSSHRSQMLAPLDLDADLDGARQNNPDTGLETKTNRARAPKRNKQRITGKNKRILGTSSKDFLDASKGKGRNVLLGKGGNDTLKGKKKDRLLGGRGRDRLDTRKGRKNILKGGGGSDILFAGTRDKVFGNGGADTLNAFKGKGRNTLKGGGGPDLLIGKTGDRLVGGKGSDEFVIINRTLPTKPLVVEDFQQGRDRLSIRNAPNGLSISDLGFRQQGANTVIAAQGQDIAILENITSNQLTAADFTSPEPEPVSDSLPPPVAENNTGTNDSPVNSLANANVTIQQRNQYSITSLDASDILLQFDLLGLNVSNTFIADRNPSSSVGVFPGAIQEYVSGRGTLPFGVAPAPFVPDGTIDLSAVDLRAELVQDANRNSFVTNGRDTIEYVFTDPNISTSNNSSSPTTQNSELLRLSLDFTSNLFAGFVPNFDQSQAINSIEYIIENDLLAYAVRVQVAGTQLFRIGNIQNTQFSKTYIQSGDTQFRLVESQQQLVIQDQNNAANVGFFEKAIENFQDELTGQSFLVGNLSTSLQGNQVTYTIANGTLSRLSTLDLTGTSFDPDSAVNNLSYILANDLLKLAFFG